MRMAVADIHTVAELLGHKDLAAVRRYQRLSLAFLAEAVDKLDAVLGPALGPKSAEKWRESYQDVTVQLALTGGGETRG
jgi:hypothetical protein